MQPHVDVGVVEVGVLGAELAQVVHRDAELGGDALIEHRGRDKAAGSGSHAAVVDRRLAGVIDMQHPAPGSQGGGRGDDVELPDPLLLKDRGQVGEGGVARGAERGDLHDLSSSEVCTRGWRRAAPPAAVGRDSPARRPGRGRGPLLARSARETASDQGDVTSDPMRGLTRSGRANGPSPTRSGRRAESMPSPQRGRAGAALTPLADESCPGLRAR